MLNVHATPDFVMLHSTERSVDLIRLEDGREGAVVRYRGALTTDSSTHLIEQGDDTYRVVMYPDVWADDPQYIEWTMPADAAIHFVATVIAAL